MEIDRNINLDELLDKAQKQSAMKNLSWRPCRVTVSEILALVEDGGELNSYFSYEGKQSILVDYNGFTFIAESSELVILNNPEGSGIINRYIH